MTINKFNYEAFALDYLEGNLSIELAAEMERFLGTHPAIEAELSGMAELVILEADESIIYTSKASLYKSEKVIGLNKRWLRPLFAAASIALLLMSYFMGYQAGEQHRDGMVVVEGSSGSSSSEQLTAGIETKEMKAVESLVATINEQEAESKVTKSPKNNTTEQTITAPIIVEHKLIEKEKELHSQLVVNNQKTTQISDNQKDIQDKKIEIGAIVKQRNKIYPIAKIELKPSLIVSINDTLSNLNKTLRNDLPIDEVWLATSQKKKRSFKDLLGRFPINNIKDALIPSYYKEENAGQ